MIHLRCRTCDSKVSEIRSGSTLVFTLSLHTVYTLGLQYIYISLVACRAMLCLHATVHPRHRQMRTLELCRLT